VACHIREGKWNVAETRGLGLPGGWRVECVSVEVIVGGKGRVNGTEWLMDTLRRQKGVVSRKVRTS
jgi:hypothetical protein